LFFTIQFELKWISVFAFWYRVYILILWKIQWEVLTSIFLFFWISFLFVFFQKRIFVSNTTKNYLFRLQKSNFIRFCFNYHDLVCSRNFDDKGEKMKKIEESIGKDLLHLLDAPGLFSYHKFQDSRLFYMSK